ncbi:MAG: L,D-transpeptidase [Rhizobiales bacterium]|nr:L,D-transpeptidase [Hyphomicrobiales bacterium]
MASIASAQEGFSPFFSASPAMFDAYDSPREIDRRDAPAARKRHKAKRNSVSINQQKLPAGPLHIIVSIAKQRATLFSNGIPVAEAPISTGVPGHPTPMGVFSVISKSRYHKSNIYSGAPMPYMQRITWSGIALHQGPLPGFPASHGCIRLPEAFAIKLWALSKLGARVIVTRDETAPFRIENARLFVPKKPEEKPAIVAETPTPAFTALTVTIVEPAAAADPAKLPDAARPAAEQQKRKGPVQVFVSRKEAKLYVRQDFAPLFDAPVTIAEPDKPWGTHVFTLMDVKDDKPDWSAVTIPSGYAHRPDRHHRKLSAKEFERRQQRFDDLANAPTAAQALERFVLPQDAIDRISQLLAPGSALIVSDNALSDETGQETDFIVLTQ